MIYITGDAHGDLHKFSTDNLKCLNHKFDADNDYFIICGDFGIIWNGGPHEKHWLDWLNDKPFTTLFVTGNHENYDLLKDYPVTEWNGGKVQKIRDRVIRLMNGQVFSIDGCSIFTMGGAACHDIDDGILDPEDPNFHNTYVIARKAHLMMRVKHYSWWEEEIPSPEEMEEGRKNLDIVDWKVDAVITHCAPTSLNKSIGQGLYPQNVLTDYLEEIKDKLDFNQWCFGHYHDNRVIDDKFVLLYEDFIDLKDSMEMSVDESPQIGEIL